MLVNLVKMAITTVTAVVIG